jgi:alkaline phosphatase D
MKSLTAFLFLLLIVFSFSCQKPKEIAKEWKEDVAIHFDSTLAPFYHGVASGDPLADRIIIWTRVTPRDSMATIPVKWEMAEDENFASIYKSDTLSTTPARDYTVKVDVDALKPDRTYYYRFTALGKTSMTGRTKTAPVETKDSLKFAVVSCSNWEFGYFNAYDRIADRPVLDAVIHLGDYIYEYATGKYGDTTIHRINFPKNEIVSLKDYRTRYSLYRLDKGLRRVHQLHPFITIWDDHEIANNSYVSGAQNHQPEEGDYNQRKGIAKQVYYEWLPIRESGQHYRAFSFGPLADLIMLDERLAGRTQQPDSLTDPRYNSEEQSMLGAEQLAWFEQNMKDSKATWKVIGNQVIFSVVDFKSISPERPRNLDSWDGYPKEKKKIVDFIGANKIQNIVFITGDTHSSWAMEATNEVKKNYVPFAVELGTTSISSANSNEYKPDEEVKKEEEALMKSNSHLKFMNDRDHGYLLVTLYPEKTKAEWYYVETLRKPDGKEFLGQKYEIANSSPRLKNKIEK